MSSNSKLRDFSTKIPEEHTCPLCNLSNKGCKCIKHKCKCDILAMYCKWPGCLCKSCLDYNENCECQNG